MAGSEGPPRWDLSPLFAGFDDPAWTGAKARLAAASALRLAWLASPPPGFAGREAAGPEATGPEGAGFVDWLLGLLALEEECGVLHASLAAYAFCRHAVATRDPEALAEIEDLERLALPLRRADLLFRAYLAPRAAELKSLAAADPRLADLAYRLREDARLGSRQLEAGLEDLADELALPGAKAWERLRESLSAEAGAAWDARTGERRSVSALRALATDPDRSIRRKAFHLELEAWKSVELPLAAALNGVIGHASILDRRRGREDALDAAAEDWRMTRTGLETLVAAMESSVPSWRRYLAAKADALGLARLAYHDLAAPLSPPGAAPPSWTWAGARELVASSFAAFDPAMGDFAERAFAASRIDAEPREGKVGGAFCACFPPSGGCRLLCNFDGSLASLASLAHELGHAWHHGALEGLPLALARYSPILGETASLFAEALLFEGVLAAAPEGLRATILEARLQRSCRMLLDTLARFRLERELRGRRSRGEIPPADLRALGLEALERSYGPALDPEGRHPYLWAATGHLFRTDASFGSLPYAFGFLLATSLREPRRTGEAEVAAAFRALLADSGKAGVAEAARRVGVDIESPEAWAVGLAAIGRQVEEFEGLAGTRAGARAAAGTRSE